MTSRPKPVMIELTFEKFLHSFSEVVRIIQANL